MAAVTSRRLEGKGRTSTRRGRSTAPLPAIRQVNQDRHRVSRDVSHDRQHCRQAEGIRWKPTLNAFAITFGDRFPAAETY
jgi:hypothetical protein